MHTPLLDAFRHLRPRAWPIVMVHFLSGAVVAHGGGVVVVEWESFLLAAILWAVGLNGGTLALNSAFDRDEGDVGYLDRPPPVSGWLLPFSLLFLLGGQALALLFGLKFAGAYFICLVMSLLYSVPPFRWKRLAGVDLFINCFGYGFWTFLAGGLLPAVGLDGLLAHLGQDPRGFPLLSLELPARLSEPFLLVGGGFFFLFGALYPLTQLYQVEEDRRRGDKTLVIWLGPRASLLFAQFCVVVAHAGFGAALILRQNFLLAGKIGLFSSFFLWSALLLLWYIRFDRYPQKAGMYRALVCWAFTNLAVLALFWTPI